MPCPLSRAVETNHLIAGPAGQLDLRLLQPATAVTSFAVVCHPHPLHGGTLDNKVVYTLTRWLAERGALTVRFNFRGIGRSEGQFDHGQGEQEDLAAVVAWLHTQMPNALPLTLAGFSFGSFVAAAQATTLGASTLLSIAPPVQRFDFSRSPMPTCPWWIVMGDADEVVDPQSVFDWAATLPANATLLRMDGAGHYFHGRLVELRELLDQQIPVVSGTPAASEPPTWR